MNETGRTLRAEVVQAKKAYQAAYEAFQSSAVGMLPRDSDNTRTIIEAGKVYRTSMDEYIRALTEFNDFVKPAMASESTHNSEVKTLRPERSE